MPVVSMPGSTSIAHKGSGGTVAYGPSVCLTVPGSHPIPIPYPNVSSVPAAKTDPERRQALRGKLQQAHYELMNQKSTPARTAQLLSAYVSIIMELGTLG